MEYVCDYCGAYTPQRLCRVCGHKARHKHKVRRTFRLGSRSFGQPTCGICGRRPPGFQIGRPAPAVWVCNLCLTRLFSGNCHYWPEAAPCHNRNVLRAMLERPEHHWRRKQRYFWN